MSPIVGAHWKNTKKLSHCAAMAGRPVGRPAVWPTSAVSCAVQARDYRRAGGRHWQRPERNLLEQVPELEHLGGRMPSHPRPKTGWRLCVIGTTSKWLVALPGQRTSTAKAGACVYAWLLAVGASMCTGMGVPVLVCGACWWMA